MKHIKHLMNKCWGCGRRYSRKRKSGQFEDKCKTCTKKERRHA